MKSAITLLDGVLLRYRRFRYTVASLLWLTKRTANVNWCWVISERISQRAINRVTRRDGV